MMIHAQTVRSCQFFANPKSSPCEDRLRTTRPEHAYFLVGGKRAATRCTARKSAFRRIALALSGSVYVISDGLSAIRKLACPASNCRRTPVADLCRKGQIP